MRAFMMVAMLLALLVTGWLVVRSVTEVSTDKPGPVALKPIERADQARRTMDAANQNQERRLDELAR